MTFFDDGGHVNGQLFAHHDISQVYTHTTAAFLLFVITLISTYLVYTTLKKSIYSWPAILGGLIYIGLIGLGDTLKHIPMDPFIQLMAHYLVIFSLPIAVFTFYLGMTETVSIIKEGPEAKLHSTETGLGVFAAALIGIIVMAMVSQTPLIESVEGPFLIIVALITLVSLVLVLRESTHFAESNEMLYLPLISINLALLTLSVTIGRYEDFLKNEFLSTLSHTFHNILLTTLGPMVLLFSLNVWYSHRIGRLFVLGVSSKKEMKVKKKAPAKKKFRIDEQ
jgi:hypothetical protein